MNAEDSSALYLSDERLSGLGIGFDEIVASIESAIRSKADGTLLTAPKSALLPGDGRYVMSTLSAGDNPPIVVIKSVLVCPDNPARGLPGINGAIMVLDSQTGLLRAIMGSNWVTAVRTAGLSAVAAKRLANPESSQIAFIGSGVQARSHLDAFADLFPLVEVRTFGRGRANIDRLGAAARAKGLAFQACDNPQEALDGADLVVSSVTLSYSIKPFVDARWLKPGAFAAITDLAMPWLPEGMSAFDTVIVDDREQEAASDKPMVAPALIRGDLTDLVLGAVAGRYDPGNRSAFVFRGIAIGDFAVAALAFARATAGSETRISDG